MTFAAFTVGMTTATSATRAVYPPSRPTMPRTALPRCFANCNAATKLGLTFFSTSPPPTENFEITPVVTHEAYDYSVQEEMTVG